MYIKFANDTKVGGAVDSLRGRAGQGGRELDSMMLMGSFHLKLLWFYLYNPDEEVSLC